MPMHGRNIVYIAVSGNANNAIYKVLGNKNLGTNTPFQISPKKKKGGGGSGLIFSVSKFIHIYLFSFLSMVYFCAMEHTSTAQYEKTTIT